MKTTNTLGIAFYLKKCKTKNGKAPIYVRITVNGKRSDIATKQNIELTNWHHGKGFAVGKSENIKKLNTYLEQIRSQLVVCYQELHLKKGLITSDALKSLFCGTEEKEHSLISVLDYHNNELAGHLKKITIGKFYTLKKYIIEFLQSNQATSDIYLSQLNYKWLIDFEMFLKNKKGIGQNSTMKHIMLLRKIITIAINNEWLSANPFAKYKISFTKSNRTYLEQQELQAIEEKSISFPRLQHVQDLFIFSCYTGLAYIDLFNLTSSNISIGIDGEYWINTARKKTEQPVRVPLLPKAAAILEKYKSDPAVIHSGKLLPNLSNQKLNAYLKELADLCGITKTLTFHMARHTFATTVTLTNGVPIETVSSMLGHSSIKTTQIYAKVIQHKVSADMQALRQKLNNANNPQMLVSNAI